MVNGRQYNHTEQTSPSQFIVPTEPWHHCHHHHRHAPPPAATVVCKGSIVPPPPRLVIAQACKNWSLMPRHRQPSATYAVAHSHARDGRTKSTVAPWLHGHCHRHRRPLQPKLIASRWTTGSNCRHRLVSTSPSSPATGWRAETCSKGPSIVSIAAMVAGGDHGLPWRRAGWQWLCLPAAIKKGGNYSP